LATVSTNLNRFANSEVELRRVGGVNASFASRDPVYNYFFAVELLRLVTRDVIDEKVINIDQNWRNQTTMHGVSLVSFQMVTESVGTQQSL